MNKTGPIIVVEDDPDDQKLLKDIFSHLQIVNEIIMFNNGTEAYEFLNTNTIDPFIIISDINMPVMNGIQLREKIHRSDEVRMRLVPFIYLTTAAANHAAIQAYISSVQGFFTKPLNVADLQRTIKSIIDYWSNCTEPRYV